MRYRQNMKIDERISGPNALTSEYQRDDICAERNLNVSYVTHDTGSKSMGRIFGTGFTEELPRLARANVRAGN